MKICIYSESDAERWDHLVNTSSVGTFLHMRKFLSYHGERFADVSTLIQDDNGRLVGLFPAAVDPSNSHRVVSHPGLTYGGLICSSGIRGHAVVEVLTEIMRWYKANGFSDLVYKAVPVHLHDQYSQSDYYALWRANGRVVRRDLWNVIRLDVRRHISKGCKWAIGRAGKNHVSAQLDKSRQGYELFHRILTECLNDRQGVRPVHTCSEMIELQERFPGEIDLWLANNEAGKAAAGLWIFKIGKRAWHTQYIASTAEGRDIFALNLLIETVIREAEAEGVQYFSFGASTYDSGRKLNDGLFDFKAGFGAGAVVQDFYLLDLSERDNGQH